MHLHQVSPGIFEDKGFVDVLALEDLPPQAQHVVRFGIIRVLLCHSDGKLYAVEDMCPHALQPLRGREIQSCSIVCPKHGARFDLETGQPLNSVTSKPLKTFNVQIGSGRIGISAASTLT